jgi:hypothetical protein
MTTKASDLAARFATSAVGAHTEKQAVPADSLGSAELPGKGVSPIVRLMVKLPKPQHRFIRQFALDNESDVSTIVRTIFRRIESDPVFAEEIRNLLREAW